MPEIRDRPWQRVPGLGLLHYILDGRPLCGTKPGEPEVRIRLGRPRGGTQTCLACQDANYRRWQASPQESLDHG